MPAGSQVARYCVAILVMWILLLVLAGSGQRYPMEASGIVTEVNPQLPALQLSSDNNEDDLDNSIEAPNYFKMPPERQQTANRAEKLQPPSTGTSLSSDQLEAIGRRLELELRQSGALMQLSQRLQLQERLVAQAQAKLLDTERRLASLESCECRKDCRWRPTSTLSTSTNSTGQELLKLHGQVWEHQCDICSCHAGQVRCMHRQCPEPQCPEPSYVAGKCCPVCHKQCVYKSQTVKHANKLVINSSQDTCKECLCIDGRLECRRIWLARGVSRQPRRASLALPELDSAASTTWDSPEDTLSSEEELVEEQWNDEEAEEESQLMSRYRRHKQTYRLPRAQVSICPEPECPVAKQFRLADDCCVYCAGFDFCHHKNPCHANAHCSNNHNVTITASTELQHMFQCQCNLGFNGDGRSSCQDIDECLDSANRSSISGSHTCDPKTTDCVNMPGSYKCACKPGFRSAHLSEPESTQLHGPQTCVDVDECLDEELNKCHPQARCINLSGSYECRCRKGYTGDGRHCHKWFSPGPQVAAYQHQAGEPQSSQLLLLPIGQGSPEDLLKASGYSSESDGSDNNDDDQPTNTNEDPDYQDTGYIQLPLVQPLSRTPQHLPPQNVNQTNAISTTTTTTTSTQALVVDQEIAFEAPNTRTMFFHVPPKLWRTKSMNTSTPKSANNDKQDGQPPASQVNAPSNNNRYSSSTSSHSASISDSKPSSKLTQSSDVSQHQLQLQQDDRSINNSRYANHTKSDTNDSLYIQEAAPHNRRTSIETTSLPLKGPLSSSMDAMKANTGQQQRDSFKPFSASGSTNNLAHSKKPEGSLIIASATTSSTKSHLRYDFGPSYSRNHRPSAFQQQQLSQHSSTSYSAATTSIGSKCYLAISTILISLFLQSYYFIDRFYLNHIVTFYFI